MLCDISILNPNVFFEFGIRTALDKPVALVRDNMTTSIPFDTNMLHCHKYGSLEVHTHEKEKQALTKHVQEAYKKSKDHNALWKYFGVAQPGTFKPEEAELGEKIDMIMGNMFLIERQLKKLEGKSLADVLTQKFERKSQEETNQEQEEYRMKLFRLAAAKAIDEVNIMDSQKPKV